MKSNVELANKVRELLEVWEINIEIRVKNGKLYPEQVTTNIFYDSKKFWKSGLKKKLNAFKNIGIDTDFFEVQSIYSSDLEKLEPIFDEMLLNWVKKNIKINEKQMEIRFKEIKRKIIDEVASSPNIYKL